MTRGEIVSTITNAARVTGVPVEIALALAYHESKLDPNAEGDAGTSFGLFQIKLQTAEIVGFRGSKEELKTPAVNALFALRHLAGLIKGYGIAGGLSAYNGPGRPIQSNQEYVGNILLTAVQVREILSKRRLKELIPLLFPVVVGALGFFLGDDEGGPA